MRERARRAFASLARCRRGPRAPLVPSDLLAQELNVRRIARVLASVLIVLAALWYRQGRSSKTAPGSSVTTAAERLTVAGGAGLGSGHPAAGEPPGAASTPGEPPRRPWLDCTTPAGDVARVDGEGVSAASLCDELRALAGEPGRPPSDAWRAQARQLRDQLVDALLVRRALQGLGSPLPEGDVEAAMAARRRDVAVAARPAGPDLAVLRRQLRARLELERLVAMHAAGEPTDAELRAAYDADPARHGDPGQASVTAFVKRLDRRLPDAHVAAAGQGVEEFLAMVSRGTAPTVAATQAGLTALPPFVLAERGVEPALRAAAFGLSPGAWTAPTRTSIGWVVLRLDSIRPAEVLPFDQVRDAVRVQVEQERRRRGQTDLLRELRGAAIIEELVAW